MEIEKDNLCEMSWKAKGMRRRNERSQIEVLQYTGFIDISYMYLSIFNVKCLVSMRFAWLLVVLTYVDGFVC